MGGADIEDAADALGGELKIVGIGTGVRGDTGPLDGLGGEAANGVYSSTAAPDSLGDDLEHVSIKR